MAEAQSSLDVSDLKENFLECPICLEQFDQAERRPRLLVSCLHAFCSQCLDQLIKKEGGGQITCPNCRHVQMVKGNAQSLPVDPVRNKLVDYVQFKKGKTIPCTDCPEGSHAVARCHECQSYMCARCKEAHHRNRLSRKHTCQSLDEALSEPIKNFLSHFCKDHPDHKIEFYCSKCSSLCCVSCSIVKHKGHDLDPIEDAANSTLSSLKTKMDDVEKSVSELRRRKLSLEQESSKHEINLKLTTVSINQTFEQLIGKLKIRQNELITNLKERTEGTVNGLKKQREATEDSLAQMESALEYFKQMETKSDDCEVLSAAPVLVESLEASTAGQTQDVQHPTLTFSPGFISTINSNLPALGEIHSSTTPSTNIGRGKHGQLLGSVKIKEARREAGPSHNRSKFDHWFGPPRPVMYTHKALIFGIPFLKSPESLPQYLEWVTHSDVNQILFGTVPGKVVVSFSEASAGLNFADLTRQLDKKPFKPCGFSYTLKASPVQLTRSVKVYNITTDITEDALSLYFLNKRKSGGGEVLELIIHSQEGYAVVTFRDVKVAEAVCKHKHIICGVELGVHLYFGCLGQKGGTLGPTNWLVSDCWDDFS